MLLLELERRGRFAALRPNEESRLAVMSWMEGRVPNPNTDLHVTVVFDKKNEHPWKGGDIDFVVTSWKLVLWGKVLVACFEDERLSSLHARVRKDYSLPWGYDSYIPHMTLSYDHEGEIPEGALPPVTFDRLTVTSYR